MRRDVDLVVVSDVHLGTYGCRANELCIYLQSVRPKKLILNGDIIDGWQFSKSYFPDSHIQVLRCIIQMMNEGLEVYYITGNHDEVFRKFSGLTMGKFSLVNKVILEMNDQKFWFFHGDVFDVTMKQSKWLAKLGGKGYDLLIVLNGIINFILQKFGKEKMSLSKKIKNSVKQAVKFINDFEETAINIAIENEFDYVICGHIHQPCMRAVEKYGKKVVYLNSGDWIENLTALEYDKGVWSIYRYEDEKRGEQELQNALAILKGESLDKKSILEKLIREIRFL